MAIKYNKIFVDAFWNSRKESFGKHLFRLMTSWALVCDVYFLEPQSIRPGKPARVSVGVRLGLLCLFTSGKEFLPPVRAGFVGFQFAPL